MSGTKTLNVYLPAELYEEIDREAVRSSRTKGGVVRDRLQRQSTPEITGDAISDLFGTANDLPVDLSARKDSEFRDYGQNGHR